MRGPRRRRRRQPAASRGSETDADGLVEQHPLDAEIEVLAAASRTAAPMTLPGNCRRVALNSSMARLKKRRAAVMRFSASASSTEVAEMHRRLQLGVALDDGQERSDALA